jgi:hypothetical protein
MGAVMKGKLVFATGLAVGYVFGTRAGRRRYEQIKANAQKLWSSQTVQKGVDQVQSFVDEHSPDVPAVLADGAKKVIDKVASSASSKGGAKSANAAKPTTRRAPAKPGVDGSVE